MIKYYKLFDLLSRRELKKTELLKIMSPPTLAKLSKGEVIKTDIIDKICEFLHCQPGDIMEHIEREELEDGTIMETVPQINKQDYISFTPKSGSPGDQNYTGRRLGLEYIKSMEKDPE